ncbi:hypothetical protein [Methanobrevibacter sp.]|uniref:hypothetical protein n=1 Tax=Methanobrevibacter sp. TaxID=66852 RepID=UPI00388E1E61
MKKGYILIIFIILMFSISSVSAGIFNSLLGDASPVDEEHDIELKNVTFKVYAIETQSTQDFFDPTIWDNNDTKEWLESLDGYAILPTNGDFLVMNESDAAKLPVVEDESFYSVTYNVVTCNITEAHSLGHGLVDLLLVEDVNLVNTETKNLLADA